MHTYDQTKDKESKVLKNHQAKDGARTTTVQPAYPTGLQHAGDDAGLLSPANLLQLQRTVGNRAVVQLITEQEQSVQPSLEEEEELPCPGNMIRSEGQGRGEGYGQGKGPIGQPYEDERR